MQSWLIKTERQLKTTNKMITDNSLVHFKYGHIIYKHVHMHVIILQDQH